MRHVPRKPDGHFAAASGAVRLEAGNRRLARVLVARQPTPTRSGVKDSPGLPDPGQFQSFDAFGATALTPYSNEYLRDAWDSSHRPENANDIVVKITEIEKPSDLSEFWDEEVRPRRADGAGPLSELEQEYIRAFRDPTTPEPLRMREPVDPAHLTDEEPPRNHDRKLRQSTTRGARESGGYRPSMHPNPGTSWMLSRHESTRSLRHGRGWTGP